MANVFHSIKAKLFRNHCTGDPNDYYARVISERTLSVRDVCRSAVSRGGAPGDEITMNLNVESFLKEMLYLLKNGYSVNANGYFSVTAQIKGVFRSSVEKFDSLIHTIYFLFSQGEMMREGLDEVSVEILGIGDASIVIQEVTDMKSGSVNDRLTPGRNLRIRGDKLKIAGDHSGIGIYFVNQADGKRIRVEDDEIVINHPSELMIIIPDLPSGLYTLEVGSQYTNSRLLKEPRTASFDKLLNVP